MKKLSLLTFLSVLSLTLPSCTNDDDNEPKKSSEKEITAFSFLATDNDELSVDVHAEIDQDKKMITAELPEGTAVTSLKATVAISENATIDPENEITTDFSQPVIYTVTAEDETTAQYTVVITVTKSDDKQIESFVFLASDNDALLEDIEATINEDTKTINAELPYGTPLNTLKPTLVFSEGATVVPNSKTETDFTSPVLYTVTAANESTENYTVTLTNAAIMDRDVLIAWYNANPNNTINWDFSKDISEWEGITVENGRVTKIEIRDQGLSIITPLIGNLSELYALELIRNNTSSLPPEIGQLKKLQFLDLTHNSLIVLPVEIGNLSAMEYLRFHNNDIQQLPATIGNLKQLIELNLTFNDLNTLPKEIGTLTKLKSLSLYGSRNLESIPIEIGNLTELLNLSLGYCNLSSVPVEIGNLTKLVDLRIDENRLTAIPLEIGNLSSLKSLKLQKNQLTALPSELGMLTGLIELNIEENQITVIPQEICDLDDANLILIKDPEASCP